jgi:hypothetical protein
MTGALCGKPRPGARRKVDGKAEARLIALACSDPPEGYEHWTLRLLANELVALEVEYISYFTVREVLRERSKAWAREVLVHSQSPSALRGQDGGCTLRFAPTL